MDCYKTGKKKINGTFKRSIRFNLIMFERVKTQEQMTRNDGRVLFKNFPEILIHITFVEEVIRR